MVKLRFKLKATSTTESEILAPILSVDGTEYSTEKIFPVYS